MNFALRDWDVLCFVLQGVCALMRVCVERGGREGFARVDCKERYLRMFVSFGMKVICKNVTKCFVCNLHAWDIYICEWCLE